MKRTVGGRGKRGGRREVGREGRQRERTLDITRDGKERRGEEERLLRETGGGKGGRGVVGGE